MATLQKIRSKGPLLLAVIGLALFAFIAEEAFRSWQTTSNNSKQQIGEIAGESISVQDYQSMIDEYTEVIKMTSGRDNLTDDEMTQVKDQVWQTYIQENLIFGEAKKLGLEDSDLESVMKENMAELNNELPSYCKLSKIEIRNEEFSKTAKNSIRRFLYS